MWGPARVYIDSQRNGWTHIRLNVVTSDSKAIPSSSWGLLTCTERKYGVVAIAPPNDITSSTFDISRDVK